MKENKIFLLLVKEEGVLIFWFSLLLKKNQHKSLVVGQILKLLLNLSIMKIVKLVLKLKDQDGVVHLHYRGIIVIKAHKLMSGKLIKEG
jgi:hypothetical protein